MEVCIFTIWSCSIRAIYTDADILNYRYLVGFKNLLKSIECQNIASSFGIKYYGRGHLASDGFVSFIRYEFLAREFINSTLNYVPSLREMYVNITSTDKYKKMKAM